MTQKSTKGDGRRPDSSEKIYSVNTKDQLSDNENNLDNGENEMNENYNNEGNDNNYENDNENEN